jgi:hypothetical protein
MEAQRWRLAMFASDGWFWDDPTRPETAAVLRHAARAARLIDGLTEGPLEQRLVRDLALLTSARSPGRRGDDLRPCPGGRRAARSGRRR